MKMRLVGGRRGLENASFLHDPLFSPGKPHSPHLPTNSGAILAIKASQLVPYECPMKSALVIPCELSIALSVDATMAPFLIAPGVCHTRKALTQETSGRKMVRPDATILSMKEM